MGYITRTKILPIILIKMFYINNSYAQYRDRRWTGFCELLCREWHFTKICEKHIKLKYSLLEQKPAFKYKSQHKFNQNKTRSDWIKFVRKETVREIIS